MKRVPIVLALLLVVAACGFAAWFALSDGSSAPTGTTETATEPAAADPAGASEETPVADEGGRRRVTDVPTEGGAPANTVLGRITHDGVGVAGATIEAYAAPAGAYDERMERAKEIFGDLFSEEELEALEGRFGGMRNRFGGLGGRDNDDNDDDDDADDAADDPSGSVSVSIGSGGSSVTVTDGDGEVIDLDEDVMQESMGAGMEMVGRMLSDPSFLEKAMDLGRMEAAGFQRNADWPRVGATKTDAEGRFELTSLPDGEVELRVQAPGFVQKKKRVDVGEADVAIELRRGALLHGVVVSGGSPVADAKVRTKTRTLTTDGAGNFRLDGAVTPRESLLVSAPGYVPTGRSVPLSAEADSDPITIDLQRAAIIRGIVVDADGSPLPGAAVRFTKGSTGFNPMQFMELAQRDVVKAPAPSAVADQNGVFEIDGIPGGAIKLAAEKRGYLPAVSDSITVVAGETAEGIELRLVRESTVTGRVTAPDGTPVKGATVKVELDAPEGMGAMIAGMFGGSWARGITADDGTYTVGGLTGGERKVRVESALYLHAESAVSVPDEDTVSKDFELRPGYTLEGSVLAPNGDPVAGASVGVKWPSGGGGNPMAAMMGGMSGPDTRGTTDAEGRFSFVGLQEGPYDLTASMDGYLDGEADDVIAGSTDVIVSLRAAATISGRVLDPDGVPIGGAWVHRKGGPRRGGANPWMAMFSQGPRVMTDADGVFHLPELDAGKYQLFARRESYAESETIKLSVAEGEHAEGVELMLRAGESLAGTVVLRDAGTPVEGALVYVTPGAAMSFNPMEAVETEPTAPGGSISAKTDADGVFVLEGLTPGKVTVEVRHKDYAAASLARVDVPGEGLTIEIGAGGVVEGVVVDDAGNAQAGTTIMLTGGAMGFGRQKTASTDANGRYRMEKVVPGSYNIMKMGGNSAFGMAGMTQVVVREGETTVHDFRPDASGRSVSGAVTRDGEPVDGAMVILAGGSVGMQMTSSGSDGTFSFADIPPGSYTVSVQADLLGGGTTNQEVNVDESGNVENVELQLTSLTISGRVTDAESGDGVPLAQVVLFDGNVGTLSSIEEIMRNQRGQAITDDKGNFTIKGVAKGTFSVRVSANGFAETTQDGVSAGAANVAIKITRGIEFEVSVVGPDGEPVGGATVTARDASGRETLSFGMAALQGATDAQGVATLRLAPGRYTIIAESSGLPSNTADVDASRGSVVIRLAQGGGFELVVTQSGKPLPGARVTVLDEAGNPVEKRISMGDFMGSGRTTDSAGRVVREGLPAGRMTIVVAPPTGETVKKVVEIRQGATEKVAVQID